MSRGKTLLLAEGYSYEADTLNEHSWHQLVQRFEDANVFQTWAYAEAEAEKRNLSPLILTCNGERVAAALVRFKRLPVFGIGLAYVHRGPMWRRRGVEIRVEHFRQILRALRNEFVCRRGLTLRINPELFDDDVQGLNAVIGEEGFAPVRNQVRNRTILMDLTPPLTVLRQGLGRNWKRNLKRAEEGHLQVIEDTDEGLIEKVIAIYEEMVSRKSFIGSGSIYRFRQIQARLPEDLKMKIMLCMSNGEVCAGLVWSAIGEMGIELHAATSNAGTQSGGSHLLRWKLVEKLKQQNAVCYNLNGIDPIKNPGTYRFKKELAGGHGRDVFYLGKFDASAGFLSELLIQLRDAIRTQKKMRQG